MFGLSNFIITEFLLIFYSLVTNVLYSYKGATAGAVGLAYQPNEDVLVHLGATVGSEHMLNGGVSIRVGDMTKGVKANTKNIAKEMDAIKAENAELKAELAEIKAMLTNK